MNRRGFVGSVAAAAPFFLPLLKGGSTIPAPREPDELQRAADLAFAVLRFASGAVPASPLSQPMGLPVLGVEAYQFIPGPSRVRDVEVPNYLASLPSPAVLIPTAMRGSIAVILVDELNGERRATIKKDFANQQAGFEEMVQQLALKPDSRVLLEFAGESHVYSLSTVRLWLERFAITVGWNLQRLSGDSRAAARLWLMRSYGVDSGGKSWGKPQS